MIPSDVTGILNFTPENTPFFPPDYTLLQQTINTFQFQDLELNRYNKYPNNLSNFQPPILLQDFTTQPSCVSNETSDEAEDHHWSIIDERRKRRMISNRESARRSRMRKQRHLDELWSQVIRLRSENSSLIEKLNQVSESHDRVAKENAKMKEEASELRQMLADLQVNSPFSDLKELQNVSCNTAYLKAESSNQSIITPNSANLLR